MEAIYIPRLLKAPQKTEIIDIDQFISGLESLNRVRGQMIVCHRGTYLEVKGKAATIVTLTCDRCLRQYNHRLAIDTTELIWLEDAEEDHYLSHSLEREVKWEDLTETLDPDGYFNPEIWLYEQLSLALPMRNVCGTDCSGLPETELYQKEQSLDHRWASLEALKKQLPS